MSKDLQNVSHYMKPNRKVSKISKKVEKDLIDINIIEKFQPDIIKFENVQEFQEYLTDNIEIMNGYTTHKLNKMYKIDGYTITKIKGDISLKKDKNSIPSNYSNLPEGLQVRMLIEAFNELSEKVDVMTQIMVQLQSALFPGQIQ